MNVHILGMNIHIAVMNIEIKLMNIHTIGDDALFFVRCMASFSLSFCRR